MSDLLYSIGKYLNYRWKAGTAHGLHSPFVYKLYNEVIAKEPFLLPDIEKIRKDLLKDESIVENEDFGTGITSRKKISEIATRSLQHKKYASLLNRLVRYFNPENVIEVGTSLGITTLYLAKAIPDKQVITLEGSIALVHLAEKNFQLAGVKNIQTVQGEFSSTLPQVFRKASHLPFVYFDGNHRYEPTMEYFNNALNYVDEHSVLVFDDIYWSSEMTRAWKEIVDHPEVSISIDLFKLGLVFFRKGIIKQHFILRY